MLHKNMLPEDMHIIAAWKPADGTERAALTLAEEDEGKVAWQQNNNSFYILIDHSVPTWKQLIFADAVAVDAENVSIEDTGGNFAATDVEAALAELVDRSVQIFAFAVGTETLAHTAGTGKIKLMWPIKATIVKIAASLNTAQATGDIFTVDVNLDGASVLSTKITIDNTEVSSLTAATPPVLSDSTWEEGQVLTVDIDQCDAATAAAGLKIYIHYKVRL